MSSPIRPGSPPQREAEERRSSTRVDAQLSAAAEFDGGRLRIETVNLSLGGAYCRGEVSLPVMTRLDVALELPGGEPSGGVLRLQAVVVRCEPHPTLRDRWDLALFFPQLEPSVRERLSSYVRSRGAA